MIAVRGDLAKACLVCHVSRDLGHAHLLVLPAQRVQREGGQRHGRGSGCGQGCSGGIGVVRTWCGEDQDLRRA